MADVRRFDRRRLEGLRDPTSPSQEREAHIEELQPIVERVRRQAVYEVLRLAGFSEVEKGTLVAYLTTKQGSRRLKLKQAQLGVILCKKNREPMDADYLGKAKHDALAMYPCPLADPDSCEGNEIPGQPLCAHAIGRRFFDEFIGRCLSGIEPDQLRLFDSELFLDVIKRSE